MNAVDTQTALSTTASRIPGLPELKALAFEKNHSHVFHAWLELNPPLQDQALLDKYIHLSVCEGVGGRIGSLLKIEPALAHQFAGRYCEQTHQLATAMQTAGQSFAQQWFEALNILANGYMDTYMLVPAQKILLLAINTGAHRFPGAAQSIAVSQAYINLILGNLKEAEEVALRFVHRPYLMPNRLVRARMYERLLPILAKTG